MRVDALDDLTVELQYETQYAVSRRMLGPEIEGEVAEGGFGHNGLASAAGSTLAADAGSRSIGFQFHRADVIDAARTGRASVTSMLLSLLESRECVTAHRSFAVLGGLLSYGIDLTDNFRRAAPYADRVLKGAKPNELPVQAPVKFELVINLKTATALGFDVPLHLQQRACARLSQSYLPKSRSDFSATFTIIAFDDSRLRWLEINT